ncbi:O-methyltransferase [Bizionia sp. KMM 8389]
MYQQKKYIQFLLNSTNQHGVHSPFIYKLITTCFYDKTDYSAYTTLQDYRKNLLKNNQKLNITDLGPGSKKTKTKQRVVSEITKTSGSKLNRAKLAYRLSKYFNPKHILELGTSLGIATQALHLGSPNAQITTIEGCPNISQFTKDSLKNLENIQFLNGDFASQISSLQNNTWDIVFIDGNHTKEATINYFETLLPTAHNDTLFIFDDIYWSKGMTEAWEIIKKHPKVTATIDTFFWGFVFFRKEQGKEHFKIRL